MKETSRKKSIIISLISIFILFLIIIFSANTNSNNTPSHTPNLNKYFINGLKPVDVYLNLEEQGFSKKVSYDFQSNNSEYWFFPKEIKSTMRWDMEDKRTPYVQYIASILGASSGIFSIRGSVLVVNSNDLE